VASATITATTAEIFGAPSVDRRTMDPAGPSLTAASSAAIVQVPQNVAIPGASTAAKDRCRDWLWGFLAVLCLSQFYFVRELVAAFALFALAFGAIAAVVVGFYLLRKSWELLVARVAALRQPVLTVSPIPHNTRKPA
jgi:hypothetical protein